MHPVEVYAVESYLSLIILNIEEEGTALDSHSNKKI